MYEAVDEFKVLYASVRFVPPETINLLGAYVRQSKYLNRLLINLARSNMPVKNLYFQDTPAVTELHLAIVWNKWQASRRISTNTNTNPPTSPFSHKTKKENKKHSFYS